MNKPTKLSELGDYLTQHPKVELRFGEQDPEIRYFSRMTSAGAFFRASEDPRSEDTTFLPLACRQARSESQVSMDEQGLTLVKFDRSMRLTYLE